jgi:hypothetical protein
MYAIGQSVVDGPYKKKQDFIRFKGLWNLISIHRSLEDINNNTHDIVFQ